MNRDTATFDQLFHGFGTSAASRKKMSASAPWNGFFCRFRPRGSLVWIFAIALGALAVSGAADASTIRRPVAAGYDGLWNVLIITRAGHCDAAYSYPFQVAGGRISSAGAAIVSGSVGRGGVVAVRISAAGSVATGSGRLGGSSGAGRWSARLSGGNCSGRWQATRS
jgi:hypothetical protein